MLLSGCIYQTLRGFPFCFVSSAVGKNTVSTTTYQGESVDLDLHPPEDDSLFLEEETNPQPLSCSTPIPIISSSVGGGKKRKLESTPVISSDEEESTIPSSTITKPVSTPQGECSSMQTSGYDTDKTSLNKTYVVTCDKSLLIKSYGCKPFQVESFLNVCRKLENNYPGGMWAWVVDNHLRSPVCQIEGDRKSGITIQANDSGILVDLKSLVTKLS